MAILYHIGRYFILLGEVFSKPERLAIYWKRVVEEIDLLGVRSLGIVALLSVFMGAVITIQTKTNIDSPLIPLYVVGFTARQSTILEFSPTIISLILAGKVGSTIAAEIGSMRVREQIDALDIMGVNSAGYLILPKIIACVLINPFLIIISMFLSIAGGYAAGTLSGLVSSANYVEGIQFDFDPYHVTYALIKTVVFAIIITTVSAYQGYYTSGGTREVGISSTKAVVYSDVVILIMNYLLTQLLLLMIEVVHLSKRFGDTQVLTDINAVFEKGKVNQVIGKSGSGKSVLAKCIVGLHHPEEGQVLYEGVSFHDMDKEQKRQVRQEIGMLFQSSALFDSLSVMENVLFPLRMFGTMDQKAMVERAHLCLKRVNIIDKDKLFPSELSGGMQKRVGIARAIAMNPKYLFVDEPNSGLDPQTSILIDELIKELTEEYGTTTIVITHDMNSVMETGDNIFFIHQGHLWWKGTRDEMLMSENKELNEFIFASGLMRQVRKAMKGR